MNARRSISWVMASLCTLVCALVVGGAPASAQRLHAFGFAFGEAGAGDGQLSRPGTLAVNEATGDVYVIDRGNSRVEIFDSAGSYVGQFDGSGAPTGAFSWPPKSSAQFAESEGSIAVDNSTDPLDPSKGDVYVLDTSHNVIDKFSASGTYIGQITGPSPSVRFSEQLPSAGLNVVAVAVTSTGVLWTQLGTGGAVGGALMDQFGDAVDNEYVGSFRPKPNSGEGTAVTQLMAVNGFAFDSEGDFYVGLTEFGGRRMTVPIEFSPAGEQIAVPLDNQETTGMAVDTSSNDVYVDHEGSVAAYTPSTHALIERFGSGEIEASEGIAVDVATGTVYAANANSEAVDVFTAYLVPDATTAAVSGLTETSATVGGMVNPDGLPVTSCVFEYGTTTAYGQSEPCSPSPGSGSGPVSVSAQLKGLTPLTEYHFRVSASNANGTEHGQDRTFITPQPVAIAETNVSDVSSDGALLGVLANPGGADTTYQFEYGTSVSYGQLAPRVAGDLGSGTTPVPASVRVEGLLPETTYHVRVTAHNLLGTVYGPDQTFTTQAGGGTFQLPDGRAWELVSPPNKGGSFVEPVGGHFSGLVQAAADGSGITYTANAAMGSGVAGNPTPFKPTQILSRRTSAGWVTEDIAAPRHERPGLWGAPEYYFFSSDLSQGLLENPLSEPLSPETDEATPYLRDDADGSYTPLLTPDEVTPQGTTFGPLEEAQNRPNLLAATPDLSHVIFNSPYALTNNAVATSVNGEEDNIYEWSVQGLKQVNVLPGSSAGADGGDFGGHFPAEIRGGLSNDGSRVIFTAGPTSGNPLGRPLYLRDMVAEQTVQVDAPAPGMPPPPDARAMFQLASGDASKVFFLDEQPLTPESKEEPQSIENTNGHSDLYVYETASRSLKDLTVDANAGEYADVQNQVVGASENGSIVYFVATGKLAEGAQAGRDNLYVESEAGSTWSAPKLVAVLSEEDSPDWSLGRYIKDVDVGHLTARVSKSGRYLAFMSQRSLTGYDNRDAVRGLPDQEVYLYDESTGRLRCVSCNPSGARPVGVFDASEPALLVDEPRNWIGESLAGSIPGWTGTKNPTPENGMKSVAYQSHVLFDDGRLFFTSVDGLVPQATNGREDVYEFEPAGVGGCVRADGCVDLISAGTSADESEFLDASENGDDVFFLTAAKLAPGDLDTAFDVYDAHVCSSAAPCANAPVSPPPCDSGDACKAAPAPQPAIFGLPASATFAGAGNVASAPVVSAVRTSKHPKKKRHRKQRHRKPKRTGRKSRGRHARAGRRSRAAQVDLRAGSNRVNGGER